MPKLNARSSSLTSQESNSAVIIADLVADIPAVLKNVEEGKKATKEETNFGYDNHMDGEINHSGNHKPSKEAIVLFGLKAKETGITKGVILNAIQFGLPDSNNKCDEKPMQLTNSLSEQVITHSVVESKGYKDMSFLRKMAFGFSFLPSIMFVLCFAIFLPCNIPKPCVETIWTRTFNNAEITSNLEINNNIVFTTLEANSTFLMELNPEKGTMRGKKGIPDKVIYVKCGNIMKKDQINCIVMDERGKIRILDSSTGEFILDLRLNEVHSLPIILPDCNGDGIDEIAFATSDTEINVIYSGNNASKLEINNCDSMPSKLIPWTKNGKTDIVLHCKDGEQDQITKIPQKTWCDFDKQSEGNTWSLHPKINSEKGLILHPTEDGLVLWSGNDIYMLLQDGSQRWKVYNDSHSDKNRYVLYGRFDGPEKQIALLSSDVSFKLEITILNSTDGSELKSVSIPRTEAVEVIKIRGHERDFTLLLLKTVHKDVVSETIEQIGYIFTTVVKYLSDKEIANSPLLLTNSTIEELVFLELDGSTHKIQNVEDTEIHNRSITVAAIQDGDLLNIYLLSKITYPSKLTEIRRIEVANWDISASKKLECSLK